MQAEDVPYFDDINAQQRFDGIAGLKKYMTSLEGRIPPHNCEVVLFDGSVRDNIAYGRYDASAADVEDAAQRANATPRRASMPIRYGAR